MAVCQASVLHGRQARKRQAPRYTAAVEAWALKSVLPEHAMPIPDKISGGRIKAFVLTEKDPIISVMNSTKVQIQTIENKIRSRVHGHGRGWVFTPKHFQDLGSGAAIDSALRRMKANGSIRQLARGLYDYPTTHHKLGLLMPSAIAVATALAKRDAIRLQPAGGYAAHLLGLTDQVPMKVVFLTDGPTRSIAFGNQTIILKRTTPKNMATAGRVSGLVIQALRHLGKDHVDERVISILRRQIRPEDRAVIRKDLIHAPAWISAALRPLTISVLVP
jgi:hypothetical protein